MVMSQPATVREPQGKTKVVVRHLPPTLKEETFLEAVPEQFKGRYCWFRFFPGRLSQKRLVHSRAYFSFKKAEDVFDFAEGFQGHTFANERGVQFKAIVEYAPYQRIPKQNPRKDSKEGTIFEDEDYLSFLATLEKPPENLPSAEVQLERKEAEKAAAGMTKEPIIVTPLMEYVRQKRAAKLAPLKPTSASSKQALTGSRGGALLPSQMHFASIGSIQQRRGIQEKMRSDTSKGRASSPTRSSTAGRDESFRDRDTPADRRKKDTASESREKKNAREAVVTTVGSGRGHSRDTPSNRQALSVGQGGTAQSSPGSAIAMATSAARAAAAAALAGASVAAAHATALSASSSASSPRHDSVLSHKKDAPYARGDAVKQRGSREARTDGIVEKQVEGRQSSVFGTFGHGDVDNNDIPVGGTEEGLLGAGAGKGRREGSFRKVRQQMSGKGKDQLYEVSQMPAEENIGGNVANEEQDVLGSKGSAVILRSSSGSLPRVPPPSPSNQRREPTGSTRPLPPKQLQQTRQVPYISNQQLQQEHQMQTPSNSKQGSTVKLLARPASDVKGQSQDASVTVVPGEMATASSVSGDNDVGAQPSLDVSSKSTFQSNPTQTAAEKLEARRLRNKDRPDRPVWTPRRRADNMPEASANGSDTPGGSSTISGSGVTGVSSGGMVVVGSTTVKPGQSPATPGQGNLGTGLLAPPGTDKTLESTASTGSSSTLRQGRGGGGGGGGVQQRNSGRGQHVGRGNRGEFAGGGQGEFGPPVGGRPEGGKFVGNSTSQVSNPNPGSGGSGDAQMPPNNSATPGVGAERGIDGGGNGGGDFVHGSYSSGRHGSGRGNRGGFRGGGGGRVSSGSNWKGTQGDSTGGGEVTAPVQSGGGVQNGSASQVLGGRNVTSQAGDMSSGGSATHDKDRRTNRGGSGGGGGRRERGGHSSHETSGGDRPGNRRAGGPPFAAEKQVWVAVQKPGPAP